MKNPLGRISERIYVEFAKKILNKILKNSKGGLLKNFAKFPEEINLNSEKAAQGIFNGIPEKIRAEISGRIPEGICEEIFSIIFIKF